MISVQEALNRLQEGNRRFVTGMQDSSAQPDHYRRALTQEQQEDLIFHGAQYSLETGDVEFFESETASHAV